MKLDTLRILSSHRLLYFSPSTHVNGRLMEYIGRKTEIYTVVCENRNHQFRNRQGVTLNGSSLTIERERERGGGSGVSRDESRRTTSSTISRYISSYRIIMYYNTRPVRRPLMDLIDFRRVPESAGQTHYFSNGHPSSVPKIYPLLLPLLFHAGTCTCGGKLTWLIRHGGTGLWLACRCPGPVTRHGRNTPGWITIRSLFLLPLPSMVSGGLKNRYLFFNSPPRGWIPSSLGFEIF